MNLKHVRECLIGGSKLFAIAPTSGAPIGVHHREWINTEKSVMMLGRDDTSNKIDGLQINAIQDLPIEKLR